MASFDPMSLLQVFAPRYNTPSMTYQGGIGLVNLSFHDLWHKQGTNWNTNSFNVFMRRREKTWIFTQIRISSKWKRCNFTSAADQASSSSLAGSNGAASVVPFAAARGVTDGDGNIGNGDSLNVGVTVGEFPQFSVEMLFHLAFSGERGACPARANSRIRPILWCPRLG